MPDRAAPRVFVTYSHDTPEHKKLVERFAAFLRTGIGLDVHLDAWYDNVRRDWSLWATEQLTKADFIVVVASPDYKRRADGTALPHEGRGAQFEAAIIRDNLTRDLRRETERVLPVVLPGRSIDEIPVFLNAHSTTRYHVDEFTEAGVADLLAAITGQGQYPMPRRGRWRGGAREEQHEPASEVPWLHASKGVKREAAGIDGVRYEQSIVLRPTSPPAPVRATSNWTSAATTGGSPPSPACSTTPRTRSRWAGSAWCSTAPRAPNTTSRRANPPSSTWTSPARAYCVWRCPGPAHRHLRCGPERGSPPRGTGDRPNWRWAIRP